MDNEKSRGQEEQERKQEQPELRRPDEAVKDLEPEEEQADAVKGGFLKVQDT